jgi:hypothetical protein
MGIAAGATACSGGVELTTNEMPVVDDAEQLRAFEVSESGTRVIVRGLTAPDDGGGGIFEYVANVSGDSPLDDDVGYVLRSRVAGLRDGRWVRLTDGEEISANWFGAKADGSIASEPIRTAAEASVMLNRRLTARGGLYRVDGLAHQTSLMALEIGSQDVGSPAILADYVKETQSTVYYFNHFSVPS